jgi:hypothetical protein
MPAQFNRFGITFQYPENWSLDEADAVAGRESVTVNSPGGGFWSVAVHSRTSDPEELAGTVLAAMGEEYEGLESSPARETIAGCETVGYDLNFFCLDLTNTARVRCLRTSRRAYTIFCQAEDHEFDRIAPVFQAITTSLLLGLAEPGHPR